MKNISILCFVLLLGTLPPLNADEHEKTLKHNKWELINFPLNSHSHSVAQLLNDDLAINDFGITWILWAFDGVKYFKPDLTKPPQAGVAFWIIQASGSDVTIDVPDGVDLQDTYAARGCDVGERCRVTHPISESGTLVWSLVGTSSSVSKNLTDFRIASGNLEGDLCYDGCSLAESFANNVTLDKVYVYNSETGNYQAVSSGTAIEPWQGFWFLSITGQNVRLLIPDNLRSSEPVIRKYFVSNAGPLNDTGGVVCGDMYGNYIDCIYTAGQDPSYGHDFYSNNGSYYFSRESGLNNTDSVFDYVFFNAASKHSEKSVQLVDSPVSDSCLMDNTTGLVWERKTDDGGLRDKDNYYTWFDSSIMNSAYDGAICSGGISCNTEAYVEAVNNQALCGISSWRLPTVSELMSLVNYNENPVIDPAMFPNVPGTTWYWSSNLETHTVVDSNTKAFTTAMSTGAVSRARVSSAHSSNEFGQYHTLLVSED